VSEPQWKNNQRYNTGKPGQRMRWIKGKSMKTTGTAILALAITTLAFSAAPAMAQDAGEDRVRTNVEAPSYPRSAQRRGVEGFAVVSYTVSADGEIENATVIEGQPEGVFDRAVIRAIEGWAYAPASDITEGMTQRFDFGLAE
jgi:protein TonB